MSALTRLQDRCEPATRTAEPLQGEPQAEHRPAQAKGEQPRDEVAVGLMLANFIWRAVNGSSESAERRPRASK